MTEQEKFIHWFSQVIREYLKNSTNVQKELDNSENPSIHYDTEVVTNER